MMNKNAAIKKLQSIKISIQVGSKNIKPKKYIAVKDPMT